jgi:hypothetical protein
MNSPNISFQNNFYLFNLLDQSFLIANSTNSIVVTLPFVFGQTFIQLDKSSAEIYSTLNIDIQDSYNTFINLISNSTFIMESGASILIDLQRSTKVQSFVTASETNFIGLYANQQIKIFE